MTDRKQILDLFDRLNVWSRRGERAPHKPLLALYALGRLSRGNADPIPFREVAPELTELLKEFGPPRKSHHPEYPFWRLQNDGVWVVTATGAMKPRQSNSDPPKGELLAHDARGNFTADVQAALRAEPGLLVEVAGQLLENHFPDSLHQDIISAVGLDLGKVWSSSRPRDPHFRKRVLVAYEYRCAVCGLDLRLGSVSVALDAAHIRWHQAGGPDTESNGLALCVLHHKLFDLGAFTLDASRVLLVSDQANGTAGFQESLLRYHGTQARPPQRPEWQAEVDHLAWHGREVFKGVARCVAKSGSCPTG